MKISIVSVGRIKEKFFREAVEEYSKRLSSYCSLKIIEVNDEKTPDHASENLVRQIKDKEGERVIRVLPSGAYKIALAIDGKSYDSEGFAHMIDSLTIDGKSHIAFIIGGSLGLSDEVLGCADMKLSFSRLTFPHQLMRVILLEQIYRSFRIIRGEPYHK